MAKDTVPQDQNESPGCRLCGDTGQELSPVRAKLPFGELQTEVCLGCLGGLQVWRKGRRTLLGAMRKVEGDDCAA